ncbi:WD40 repeat domain-containing protein [Micromonospora sp. NBC_01655]|uniref:WD40 repeat domain-containing protein n=1 Tax=Micromonospora sp. NBC_01655 TaxID=2975983 RepID=UPI002254A21D|nr:WD40 repeat domain-containing protein [Micromonospora sp. NBC_01655]MCX4474627.1 WD40 repeat domain-containing protein [Micromonospora sp. NBC_01655]
MQHIAPISGVACWKDEYVATAGYDNQLIVWDAATHLPVARSFHDHLANQCTFSPCGRFLASASSDHTARLWRVPDLTLAAVYAGHDDDVEMVAFRADGERVATASRDRRIRVFTREGGLVHVLAGHEADVISVQWLAGGRRLVSSSDDGTVRLWDAEAGRLEHVVDLGDCETDTVVVGPDGRLYAGNDDGEIVVIDGGEKRGAVRAHDAGIKRLQFDQATDALISMSYDRRVKVWSASATELLTLVSETAAPPSIWMRSAAAAPNGRTVFATFGSTYATYDRATGEWDASRVEDTQGVNATAVIDGAVWTVGDAGVVRVDGRFARRLPSLCNFLLEWRGDGRGDDLVLTGGQTGELFDARTGALVHRHRSPLNCGALVPAPGSPADAGPPATNAVVGAYTGEGLLFERAEDGSPRLARTIPLHTNAIKGLACDGEVLFSVSANRAAAYHAADGTLVERLDGAHDKIANAVVAVAPGLFASVSRDLHLRLWSGDGVRRIESPHRHSIKCVAACPVTSLVATGSYDGTIVVYDLAAGGWLTPHRPTAAGISSLAWSGVPGIFLASSYDGAVYASGPAVDRARSASRVLPPVTGRDGGDEPLAKLRAAAGVGPGASAGALPC